MTEAVDKWFCKTKQKIFTTKVDKWFFKRNETLSLQQDKIHEITLVFKKN